MAKAKQNSDADSIAANVYALKHWPAWAGLWVLRLLVLLPAKLLLIAGRFLGPLLKKGLGSRRKVAVRNIALCFPEMSSSDQEDLVDKTFESIGMMIFETGMAWWKSNRFIKTHSRVRGLDILQRHCDGGQGVLLLACHYTTLEMGGRILCLDKGVAKGGLYREHGSPVLERVVRKARSAYTDAMFSRLETRGAVRWLRQGNVLWYAPDQDYERGESEFVPFFGIQAATILSTLQLARLGRAKICFLQQVRNAQGVYELEIRESEQGLPSGDDLADLAYINTEMERSIRAAPNQYLWLHRRFKNRPKDEPSLYD